MWALFGGLAIAAAIVNVIFTLSGKDGKWPGFVSLACTALVVCAFYSAAASAVAKESMVYLLDVVTPVVAHALWLLVAASIIINGLCLLKKK